MRYINNNIFFSKTVDDLFFKIVLIDKIKILGCKWGF